MFNYQRRLNVLYVGSCSDTHFGIGTLFSWRFQQLEGIYQLETGEYKVVTKIGEVIHCYQVQIFESSDPHELVSMAEDLPLWPDDREDLDKK